MLTYADGVWLLSLRARARSLSLSLSLAAAALPEVRVEDAYPRLELCYAAAYAWRMLAYAGVRWRMLTYADVC